MKKIILLTAVAFSLFAGLVSIGTQPVIAQSSDINNKGQALEIAPPVIILTADPGQTITTDISIRNISGGELIVTGQLNDFVAAGEDGTPKILMDETDADIRNNPYSIINWISPMPQLDLISRQIATLPVTINVPKDAAPGGHYGVVRFTGVPPELKGTGVSLSASLGSLILVRVNGDVEENLSISEFSASQNGIKKSLFETAPLKFSERIKNTGNLHEQPSGLVTVTDMFGNKLATLGVNATAPQGNVLPGSTRLFTQDLDSKVIGNKILFGLYTATLKLTYANNQIITQTITFWVIPYTLIGFIIILIIGGFIGLRYAVKRYNQHIRNQALGIKSAKKNKK